MVKLFKESKADENEDDNSNGGRDLNNPKVTLGLGSNSTVLKSQFKMLSYGYYFTDHFGGITGQNRRSFGHFTFKFK